MREFFYNCSNLIGELNLSKWNGSEVVDATYMFRGLRKVTKIDLTNFNPIALTEATYMFDGCSSLTEIKFWNCNAINNVNASKMFQNTQLLNLDASGWKVNLMDAQDMFRGCNKMENIDISGIDFIYNTNCQYMFTNCTKLKTLKVGFNPENIGNTNNMFSNISSGGTLYYPAKYDYSKIISLLPSDWETISY